MQKSCVENIQCLILIVIDIIISEFMEAINQSRSQLLKEGAQPGQMGVAATPKCKEDAYWTHRNWTELGCSDQECFDHRS